MWRRPESLIQEDGWILESEPEAVPRSLKAGNLLWLEADRAVEEGRVWRFKVRRLPCAIAASAM